MKVFNVVVLTITLGCTLPLIAANQSVIGKTVLAVGSVKASNDAEQRNLRRRSPVFEVDSITTGSGSKAQFSMLDGGLITLKEDSLLQISQYETGQQAGENSATLDLVRGGLRSISGSIKKNGGDFKVNTPVGTIGIRGTHFQVELIGEEVVFAVWDGNIDVQLENTELLSLGVNENFAFAKVSSAGVVTPLTTAPAGITVGYSSDGLSSQTSNDDDSDSDDGGDTTGEESNEEESASVAQSDSETETETNSDTDADTTSDAESGDESTTQVAASSQPETSNQNESTDGIEDPSLTTDPNLSPNVEVDTDLPVEDVVVDNSLLQEDKWQGVDDTPLVELISNRQGTVNYNQVAEFNVASSAGAISNFEMEMVINFDNGAVPNGFISFDDPEGSWYATYAGLIDGENIDLDITFASHGDIDADGDISAGFFNGLDEIIGLFELYEVEDKDKNAGGSFVIKP